MLSNKTFEKISSIGKKHWDECANNENPFLSYTFLKNLEDSKSIGPGTSWMAKYLCIYNNKKIIAVAPMYIKLDSQGEYVFDHAWPTHIIMQEAITILKYNYLYHLRL